MRIAFESAFSPVDHSSSIPLNTQIILQVDHAIRLGRLKQGAMLPPEQELCDGFNVARSTLRRAMAHLEKRGIVSRERGRGKGTRIELAAPISWTPGTLDTLYGTIETFSRKPVTRLLSFEEIEVDEDFALESGLPAGRKVIYILRHRSADQDPIAVLENWILTDYVGFAPERLESQSLDVLLEECGVRRHYVSFEFMAVHAGSAAKFLGVSADTPVINELRRVFDEAGQYEYSHQYGHPKNQRIRGVATL